MAAAEVVVVVMRVVVMVMVVVEKFMGVFAGAINSAIKSVLALALTSQLARCVCLHCAVGRDAVATDVRIALLRVNTVAPHPVNCPVRKPSVAPVVAIVAVARHECLLRQALQWTAFETKKRGVRVRLGRGRQPRQEIGSACVRKSPRACIARARVCVCVWGVSKEKTAPEVDCQQSSTVLQSHRSWRTSSTTRTSPGPSRE
jgi:hypothetical protein